ncbi:YdhK family protein [Peribacillus butanolivorans]|uniref:YdhK family protein n=1 Tax=Peribacillus TaxID=2675229 RepID=UPI001913BE7B|nr:MULTISPECIES: YdhK family protein [unclassified Peribacillus]MBK5444964.1 YdhK family protein [Peribacillus sp. TH24]MBK5460317.1 YdhK family protein [Peribacillus sp. TH27]MBK5498491.1 YdhK family protein [Peribacillus sp. TH14]WMX56393.1 YdhK family protein [Peribacillus sp. R9-11]
MLKKRIKMPIILSLCAALFLVLGACSNTNDESKENKEDKDHSNMDMNHSSSGDVPKGLKVAESPTYEVGSQAIIESDHMESMKGAKATIVGAYDTTAYAISYTPSNGGDKVENHKWVIQEELKDAGEKTLEPGAEVTVDASHMEGMDGATAEIDFAEETTVYMVDFTPTNGGEEVKNHKWVTESELTSAE